MSTRPKILRNFDIRNLVRELSENKVSALEILREAISNAKDHNAQRIWIKTRKDQRNEVTLLIADDGDGMEDRQLAAFWGVGASEKPAAQQSIGYKGHGTKLYFDCRRLSVATRSRPDHDWILSSLEMPHEADGAEVEQHPLPDTHPLRRELDEIDLAKGTLILIEELRFEERADLLDRTKIESYCNWFTAVGDIRAGLFATRLDFHRAVASRDAVLESLRQHEGALRPIEVRLRINGERSYFPIGQGPTQRDRDFLKAWPDDVREHAGSPGLLAYGHRFADEHRSVGAGRMRDDTCSLTLTNPATWIIDDGIAVVIRLEGHRRQLDTYLEARWQNHPGVYSFEERFGLWLCRDFIPITQRNDLLRRALDEASGQRLRFELGNLRNWQVFVNHQSFRPTANRNDVANKGPLEAKIIDGLVGLLRDALKHKEFMAWVERMRKATFERRKERELKQMNDRLEDVQRWIETKTKDDAIDPIDVNGLPELEDGYSQLLKAPRSEQELFYVYGLLAGRFEMPIHVIEYDASEGVDAIAKLRVPKLVSGRLPLVRVEFKLEVSAGSPIHHFFDAIDVIICWSVGKRGDIYEESSFGAGKLLRREKSTLSPPIDTHEITYEDGDSVRTIPVVELSALFAKPKARKPSRARH